MHVLHQSFGNPVGYKLSSQQSIQTEGVGAIEGVVSRKFFFRRVLGFFVLVPEFFFVVVIEVPLYEKTQPMFPVFIHKMRKNKSVHVIV